MQDKSPILTAPWHIFTIMHPTPPPPYYRILVTANIFVPSSPRLYFLKWNATLHIPQIPLDECVVTFFLKCAFFRFQLAEQFSPIYLSYFLQEGAQPAPQGQVHFHDNLFPTGSRVFAKPWQRGKWRARRRVDDKLSVRGHKIDTPQNSSLRLQYKDKPDINYKRLVNLSWEKVLVDQCCFLLCRRGVA